MSDMQHDLDELGRRLWPRSDALRPPRTKGAASGSTPGKHRWGLEVLATVAAAAVIITVLATAIVLGRFQGPHAAPAAPPQPTAKVSPGPLPHHDGQIVVAVANSLIAIDPATGHQHSILDAPRDVIGPAYSPDGTKVAYLLASITGVMGAWDSMWVLDTLTGRTTQLMACHGCELNDLVSWSPDGSRLAFSEADQGGSGQLWVIDADGSHKTQLTHVPAGQDARQPAWSPDGNHVAFALDTTTNVAGAAVFRADIDVIRPDGSGLAVLLAGDRSNCCPFREPAWSPDGSKIAYIGDSLGIQLWLMDADGSHRTMIFMQPDCCVNGLGGPGWSPDGTRIAVVTGRTLRVMNADGSHQTSPGVLGGLGDRPAWQPVP